MPLLTPDAARTLRLDQKPDGTHILFKLIALPGQYVLHYVDGKEEVFRGTSAARLAQAFGAQSVDSGWLPFGVCRWGRQPAGDWMVRWYPPARYLLHMGNPAHPGTFTQEVALPGMVFAGIGSTYYVWAAKELTCGPDTQLFAAPLPNVYQDGRICYGSNTPPAVSADAWSSIETAWQLFVATPFIGDLSSGKSRAHPGDVRPSLAHVARSAALQYPLDDLFPYTINTTAMTVAHITKALLASQE